MGGGTAHRLELEADRPPGFDDRGLRPLIELDETVHAVGGGDGHEDLDPPTDGHDRRGTAESGTIEAKDAAKQRPPWHGDGDEVRGGGQRPGECLGCLDEEHRVGRASTGSGSDGAARRFRHAGGVGVDADDQVQRLGERPCKHGPTVTGAEVDDHPVGPGDQLIDLADVDVDDAPADHLLHSIILASRSTTPSHE